MSNTNSKKITAVIIVLAVILLTIIVVYDAKENNVKSVESTGFAMGSVISVTIYGSDDENIAQEIFDAISDEETNYISRYSEGSEIYKLNESGSLTVSEHTADILNAALEISENSGGAFDITIGTLSSLWNFDDDTQTVPAENDIAEALKVCGYEKITVEGSKYTLADSQQLDLGALGKGIGCDIALEILKKHDDVTGAVVSVGGTILTYGENPTSEYWTVGIRTPDKDDTSFFMSIKVTGTNFISTSGNYEKCFEKNGILYHHILSPETGYPADTSLKSVTVIADSGLYADALSTACYVLGTENSSNISEIYSIETIFTDNDYSVTASGGISESIVYYNTQ